MRLGHGQRRAVIILWGWTALLSGAVLVPVYTGDSTPLIPLGVVGVGLLLYTLLAPGWHARRAEGTGGVGDVGVGLGDVGVGDVGVGVPVAADPGAVPPAPAAPVPPPVPGPYVRSPRR
jgi:UDP-GlcNAc:undecaprenyl-phosphate GlcNAc-1-phosphate transferase